MLFVIKKLTLNLLIQTLVVITNKSTEKGFTNYIFQIINILSSSYLSVKNF